MFADLICIYFIESLFYLLPSMYNKPCQIFEKKINIQNI